MYRRYPSTPNPNSGQNQRAQPRSTPPRMPNRTHPMPQNRNMNQPPPRMQQQGSGKPQALPAPKPEAKKPEPKPEERKKLQLPNNPLLGLIPTSVYNPETKKVFGVLSAEDLLLAALIFLLLENEENNDPMLVYALLYILLSDYIELPF